MAANVMQTKDAMSSREGLVFINIDGQTFEFAEILGVGSGEIPIELGDSWFSPK